MADTVLGVFRDREHADKAVDELREEGFDTKDISIIMKDEDNKSEEDTGANVAGSAASGATTGGVIGGIAGLLIGLGAITIPGIGALLIGGPIAVALGLTGAAATTVSGAVTGALAGGLVGALVGLGVPEDEALEYEERVKEGAILIAVLTDEHDDHDVREILEEHGAEKIRTIHA